MYLTVIKDLFIAFNNFLHLDDGTVITSNDNNDDLFSHRQSYVRTR